MSQEPTSHRESPQGQAVEAANEEELRGALEKAFDYRGDVTITRKDGTKLEGYIFDRQTGRSLADSFVRIVKEGTEVWLRS